MTRRIMMNRYLAALIVVAFLCSSALVITPHVVGQTLDVSLATVRLHRTATVSRNDYRSRVRLVEEQTGRTLTDTQRKQLLDAMIDAELMLQDAEELSVRIRDQDIEGSLEQQRTLISQQSGQQVSERQFRELIEGQTGLTWAEYRKQVRERLVQEAYVLRTKRELFAAIKEPSDDEVRSFYEQNATQFTNPAIAHVEFLLLRTDNISESQANERQEKANQLLRTIGKSDAEFESQKQLSLDDPSFSANEALLLRENRQQAEIYGAAFMKKAFQLEGGEIAPTVVESRLGYHIMRVIEKRNPKVLLLADPILPGQQTTVKNQIQNQLLVQRQQAVLQQAVREVIADLRTRADINTFPDRL